ncbi:hypothetical protein GE253_22870 [Niveispirillum sp. SYP-B3756]|uniref:hypothetical protein n=1 Tax=Niveispirillum sp. SYP-B3756 TaxID=2662178 RepID=UPI001291DFEB|nr:hypothetical protein [Niveispirillum sp. SYP-B3756]MQP68165.1 hypothetical protein [Niveispirillum sp. SYP-B3756]
MRSASHKTHAKRRGNTIILTAAGSDPVLAVLDARSVVEISTTQGGQLHLKDGKGQIRIFTLASQEDARDALYAISSSICRWGLLRRIGTGLAVVGTVVAILGMVTLAQILTTARPTPAVAQPSAVPPQQGLQGFGLEVD